MTLVTSPDIPPEFRRRSILTMEWLGRYSMTDVMVLALMIFYVNSSGYTEASVQPGVYFFAASAMITMLAYGWPTPCPRRGARSSRSPRDAAWATPRRTEIARPAPAEGGISRRAKDQGLTLVTLPSNPARRLRPRTPDGL